jgi:hypothetical protein
MNIEKSGDSPLQDKSEFEEVSGSESEGVKGTSSDAVVPIEIDEGTEVLEVNGGKQVRLQRIRRNTYYSGNKKK